MFRISPFISSNYGLRFITVGPAKFCLTVGRYLVITYFSHSGLRLLSVGLSGPVKIKECSLSLSSTQLLKIRRNSTGLFFGKCLPIRFCILFLYSFSPMRAILTWTGLMVASVAPQAE